MSDIPEQPPDDYDVGFGKPPKNHQFPPGQSGNPKGRPKGSPTFEEVFVKEAAKIVKVNTGSKDEHLSKKQLTVRQLMNKAAKGDLRAIAMVLAMEAKLTQGNSQGSQQTNQELFAIPAMTDAEILARIAARFELMSKGKPK